MSKYLPYLCIICAEWDMDRLLIITLIEIFGENQSQSNNIMEVGKIATYKPTFILNKFVFSILKFNLYLYYCHPS